MEIREESLLGVPLLNVSGEIDHSSASDLDRAARACLSTGNGRLIIDLTACRYIDSGGLAVFLFLTRNLALGAWLAVVGPDRNVRRLFEIVGLLQEPGFRVVSQREEAAALVEGAG